MARIAGINIPQNKVVSIALTYIHGIGLYSSKKICKKLNISESTRVNQLSEEQVLKIREYIDSNHKVEGDLRRDISAILNTGKFIIFKFIKSTTKPLYILSIPLPIVPPSMKL